MSKQTSEAAEFFNYQMQKAMEEAIDEAKEEETEEDDRPQIFKDGDALEAELLRLITKIIEEKLQHQDEEMQEVLIQEEVRRIALEVIEEKPQLSEHVFSELEARKNEVKHYNNMLKMHVVSFLENLRPITESLKTARNKLETEQEVLNSKYDLVFAGIREAEEEYKHFNEAISFLRRFSRERS